MKKSGTCVPDPTAGTPARNAHCIDPKRLRYRAEVRFTFAPAPPANEPCHGAVANCWGIITARAPRCRMLAMLRREKGRAWVMKRVLLPIDGSECSLRAVQYLLDQRTDRPSPADPEIHLVNVQVPFSGHISQFINREQIAGFQRDEGAKALQGARALLDAGGVRYTVHTEVGWTAEVIVRLAGSLHCDHIVMGTHGRSALTELLVGSTTLKVLHLARVPVVLVK